LVRVAKEVLNVSGRRCGVMGVNVGGSKIINSGIKCRQWGYEDKLPRKKWGKKGRMIRKARRGRSWALLKKRKKMGSRKK